MFIAIIRSGLRYALRWQLILPLYGSALFLGLIQIWPLFGNNALYNPMLGLLADHTTDVFVDLVANSGPVAPGTIAAWSGITFLLAFLFGACYSYFSGGILSAWAGTRPFWNGSQHFFWSFTGLGILLGMLLFVALAIGTGVGLAFGATAGAITAMTLIQLMNLFGEYARAAAVVQDRRNPLILLGKAIQIVITQFPRTLSLAVAGLALHIGIALVYGSLASQAFGFPLSIALEQGVVLAWLWIKILRLAWALSLTQSVQLRRASTL